MIYFLSDAHLGSLAIERGWAHQKKLIDLLEEMSKDAVSIYMLGDMFDFWMEYFIRDKGKRQYQPFCRELHRLTKKGIHVHFFTGNHDMWTFGGLAQMTGAEIHYEPCTIQRYGKSLFLAHGDGLLPDNWETLYPLPVQKKIRRFMKLRRIFHSPFLQFCFRCLHPKVGNRNHRDYYIFGHRHIELDLQIAGGARVVILGDCFQQWTYAKLDNKGQLTLHNYE